VVFRVWCLRGIMLRAVYAAMVLVICTEAQKGPGQRPGPRNPGFMKEVEVMHEFYCAQGDRWKTSGPCRKFAIQQSKDYASKEEKKAAISVVDTEIPREIGEAQFKEMHDLWCESEESTSSTSDGDLCKGWAKQKTEL